MVERQIFPRQTNRTDIVSEAIVMGGEGVSRAIQVKAPFVNERIEGLRQK
jgi:hypothetical protein